MQKSFKTIIDEISYKIKDWDISPYLPEQAARLISEVKPWDHFTSESFTREFLSTETYMPQFSSGDGFGEPAITLWSNEKFRIELYFWNSSNTSLHSHSFAGAFTVLEGLSFQTVYEVEKVNQAPLEGTTEFKVLNKRHNFIYPGVVQVINPGDSFCHEVIHLYHPTVTFIIRTNTPLVKQMQLLQEGTFGFEFLTFQEIGALNKKLSLLNNQFRISPELLMNFLENLQLSVLLNLRVNPSAWGFSQSEIFQNVLEKVLTGKLLQIHNKNLSNLLASSEFLDSEDPLAVLTSCCYVSVGSPEKIKDLIEALPNNIIKSLMPEIKSIPGDIFYEKLFEVILKNFSE